MHYKSNFANSPYYLDLVMSILLFQINLKHIFRWILIPKTNTFISLYYKTNKKITSWLNMIKRKLTKNFIKVSEVFSF